MTVTVIRLKSDNIDCWVSERAYEYITATMSTGDWHTHKARKVQIPGVKFDPHTFRYDYLDIEEGEETIWWVYTSDGDCYAEYY